MGIYGIDTVFRAAIAEILKRQTKLVAVIDSISLIIYRVRNTTGADHLIAAFTEHILLGKIGAGR